MEKQENRAILTYYAEPCLRQDFLTPNDICQTRVFLVPKIHLYGVQPKEAYSIKSRRETEKLLQLEEGQGYLSLLKNPTLAVPIFCKDSAYLAITDGHHRARYTDRTKVPVRIIPLPLATEIFNRNSVKAITEEQFSEDLIRAMGLAQKSFDAMPSEKRPLPIPNAMAMQELYTQLEELPNFFPSFLQQEPHALSINKPYNILEDTSYIVDEEERRRNFFDNMNA